MDEVRQLILNKALQLQSEGYGDIHLGCNHYGGSFRTVPSYPFVMLGLLMAISIIDEQQGAKQ